MLVKDLLILFQALNEGVVNVLEHYFEMSHVDAEQSLTIYKNFCKQTERVVEFLSVAKKLQNILNISIPNFKHVCNLSSTFILCMLKCFRHRSRWLRRSRNI